MKLESVEFLLDAGGVSESACFREAWREVEVAIAQVVWPPGSDRFTIFDEPGKRRGKGNGVKPIKDGCMEHLKTAGWTLEEPMDLATVHRPGKLDAVRFCDVGPIALEWETGNVSSSHRALNKMALGLLEGKLAGGVLIVPTRSLYFYLTDRIGNLRELKPYFAMWRSLPVDTGVLAVIAVEHDAASSEVQPIAKGTDGRALQ